MSETTVKIGNAVLYDAQVKTLRSVLFQAKSSFDENSILEGKANDMITDSYNQIKHMLMLLG